MDWTGRKLIRQYLGVAVARKEHVRYASCVSALPPFSRKVVLMHHARLVMFVALVAIVARLHACGFEWFDMRMDFNR